MSVPSAPTSPNTSSVSAISWSRTNTSSSSALTAAAGGVGDDGGLRRARELIGRVDDEQELASGKTIRRLGHRRGRTHKGSRRHDHTRLVRTCPEIMALADRCAAWQADRSPMATGFLACLITRAAASAAYARSR